jgi:hypothetical protein
MSVRFRLRSPRIKLVENDVERQCRDLLALRGYKVHRLHCGRARFPDGSWVQLEEQGTPDWVVLHPVHAGFYLEAKRPGGALSPAQVWMHRVLTRGYRLQVAVIDDVTELEQWLRTHEEPTRGI